MEYDDNIKLLENNANLRRNNCAQKILYGFGHVYNDLCAAIWFSYTLFYFQIVLQMESTTAGSLIMIGTIFVMFGFSLIFSINPNPALWWYFIYFGSLVIFFQIGWAIVQISHLSVIPTLSNNHAYSSDLTAIRYTATVLSNITVYLLAWVILDFNEKPKSVGPEDFYKFRNLVLITAVIGIISSLIFYIGVQWKRQIIDESLTKNGIQKENTQQNGNKSFLKSFSIYFVSLMHMSSRLYIVLNLIYIPLYLEERTDTDISETSTIRKAIAVIPLVSFCASFLASIFLNYKSPYIDDKVVYLIGSTISLSGSIWVASGIPLGSYYFMYAVVCLTGIGSSATMVSSLCLTAQFVKINGCKGASVYSIVTFTDKLVSGAVVFLIQYMQCVPKELCPNFYQHVLAYACSAASILGIISLILLHYRTLYINKNLNNYRAVLLLSTNENNVVISTQTRQFGLTSFKFEKSDVKINDVNKVTKSSNQCTSY